MSNPKVWGHFLKPVSLLWSLSKPLLFTCTELPSPRGEQKTPLPNFIGLEDSSVIEYLMNLVLVQLLGNVGPNIS